MSEANLPILEEVVNDLKTPISMEELELAIKQTKRWKAPSPDGFPVRYYKWFLPRLALYFLRAINSVSHGAGIPSEALTENITNSQRRKAPNFVLQLPNDITINYRYKSCLQKHYILD